jgi:hypothetical protein
MRITRWWVVLGLHACFAPQEIPEDEFAARAAEVMCRRTRECARGDFDTVFYGMGDCVRTLELLYAGVVEGNAEADCDYDPGRAADAWVEVVEMSCEDFYEGAYTEPIDDIWGNCGGGTTYTVWYQ